MTANTGFRFLGLDDAARKADDLLPVGTRVRIQRAPYLPSYGGKVGVIEVVEPGRTMQHEPSPYLIRFRDGDTAWASEVEPVSQIEHPPGTIIRLDGTQVYLFLDCEGWWRIVGRNGRIIRDSAFMPASMDYTVVREGIG